MIAFVFGLAAGMPILANLISAAIAFVYNFVWFWFLVRFADTTAWWGILALGFIAPVLLLMFAPF